MYRLVRGNVRLLDQLVMSKDNNSRKHSTPGIAIKITIFGNAQLDCTSNYKRWTVIESFSSFERKAIERFIVEMDQPMHGKIKKRIFGKIITE